MSVTPQTQAVLLLTAYFSKPEKGDPRPLTPKEWGRFALWLRDQSLSPENLISGDIKSLLTGWSDKTITHERIEYLMGRGSALALAMEKWMRAGLWVLTRSDADYPSRLKQKLRTDSPAILFGCGNSKLLNQGGIAVVGARNASDDDLDFTRNLGAKSASQGFSIVSGGARGVDEASMLGALEAEGRVVGVLADSLLRSATSSKYRKYLMNKNLVLVSPFYPEAGFNAGNAMARNKYIYCLSDAAVVVQSGKKGGTWNGAIENIKKSWVPLWVKPTQDIDSGNKDIVSNGGNWLPDLLNDVEPSELISINKSVEKFGEPQDLFSQDRVFEEKTDNATKSEIEKESNTKEHLIKTNEEIIEKNDRVFSSEIDVDVSSIGFYEFFLLKMRMLADGDPKTVDDLVDELGVSKAQLNVWLKKAVLDKKVTKLNKPVRYEWSEDESAQAGVPSNENDL